MFQMLLRPIKDKDIAVATKRALEWQLKFMQDQLVRAQGMTCDNVTLNDGATMVRVDWIAIAEAEIAAHQAAIEELDKI